MPPEESPVPPGQPGGGEPPIELPVPTPVGPDLSTVTAKSIAVAAQYSPSTTIGDIANTNAVMDSMLGAKLLEANFIDPVLKPGDEGYQGAAVFVGHSPIAQGAIFESLNDAIAMGQRFAKEQAGSVGPQEQGTAQGQVIVNVDGKFVPLGVALDSMPDEKHPLMAQYEPGGAGTGWQPLAALNFTAGDERIAAVLDGLGNLIPSSKVAPTPPPVPVTPKPETPPPGGGGEVPPGGETPPAETPPGGETPPGETPPGETPPGDTPPGETPPGGTPPGGETPPSGETPPDDGHGHGQPGGTPGGEPGAGDPQGRMAAIQAKIQELMAK